MTSTMTRRLRKKNEVPIILINDFTESKHIKKLAELVGLIKKDGYYAVALSESQSVFYSVSNICPIMNIPKTNWIFPNI